GGNRFTVADSAPAADGVKYLPVTLNTGAGADRVQVMSATGGLSINGNNGADTVELGGSAGTRNIAAVSVANTSGRTALTVNDSADTQSRTVKMSVSGTTRLIDGLTGTGMVSYAVAQRTRGGVNKLDVRGGSGGNVFQVYDTIGPAGSGGIVDPAFLNSFRTSLSTGAGNDGVEVYATSGPLDLDLGAGLNGVKIGSRLDFRGRPAPRGSPARPGGDVTVKGAGGTNAITLDDRATTAARTVNLDGNSVSRSGAAPIKVSDVKSLAFQGGNRGNTFTVGGMAADVTVTVWSG